MIVRMSLLSTVLWAFAGLASQPALTQSAPQSASEFSALPHIAVQDSGPRTYRFSVTYYSANRTGEVIHRQRLTADYTRGLPNGEVEWRNVIDTQADGATTPFPEVPKRDYMEGF